MFLVVSFSDASASLPVLKVVTSIFVQLHGWHLKTSEETIDHECQRHRQASSLHANEVTQGDISLGLT
jgi:hypothetical protein